MTTLFDGNWHKRALMEKWLVVPMPVTFVVIHFQFFLFFMLICDLCIEKAIVGLKSFVRIFLELRS